MTCIVGLVASDGVYIGADSAGVADSDVSIRSDAKVFQRGDFLIGFTDSFRMGQLLRFSLNAAPQHPDMDVYEYMVTVFIDAVRDCLRAGGFARNSEGEERGGTFLVGYNGRLFEVNSDYQVGENAKGYAAVGCGSAYALGALSVMGSELITNPQACVEKALEAAAEFSTGVRAPFTVMRI